MMKSVFLLLVVLYIVESIQIDSIRQRYSRQAEEKSKKTKFYIIPQVVDSCLPANYDDTISVNEDDFIIRNPKTGSKVLEFPGCISVDAKFSILKPFNTKLLAYAEWDWVDAPVSSLELSKIDCTNATAEACGGVGNRCFYCDACEKLRDEQKDKTEDEQFKCPQERGIYPYRDEICINDWGDMDKDKNDIVDFLEDPKYKSIVDQFENTYNAALGTIKLTFLLGYNVTNVPRQNKIKQEKEYLAQAIATMPDFQFDQYMLLTRVQGKDSWVPGKYQLPPRTAEERVQLRKLYTEHELKNVHRRAMYEEIRRRPLACVVVTFDICKSLPDFRDGLGACV